MKTYMVTYIDPIISNESSIEIWNSDVLIDEMSKGEIIILEVYDPQSEKVWFFNK